MLLSRLNRNCEARPTLKNMLSDLRDSAPSSKTPIRYSSSAASRDEHRRGPGDPSLHRGPGYPLDRQNRHGESGECVSFYNKVTRFTDDRTPVPNDRRPAKAELDKDLFG